VHIFKGEVALRRNGDGEMVLQRSGNSEVATMKWRQPFVRVRKLRSVTFLLYIATSQFGRHHPKLCSKIL